MDLPFHLILFSAVVGLATGVLAGMFGIGGGLLVNPVLIAVVGVPAPVAVGTGVCQIIGASTSGILSRRHTGTIDWRMALTLAGGSVMGVSVGSFVLDWIKRMPPFEWGGRSVKSADFIVMTIFLAVMFGEAAFITWDLRRRAAGDHTPRGLLWKVKLPPYGRFPSLNPPAVSIPLVAWIGVVAGISTGLLGIGGGLILLPALEYLAGQRTRVAAGTSLGVMWFAAIVGGAIHAWSGNVDVRLLAALLAGSTIGAQFGSRIGVRLPGPTLRRYFVLILLLMASMTFWKLLRLLSGH